jgi:hypothetical protein
MLLVKRLFSKKVFISEKLSITRGYDGYKVTNYELLDSKKNKIKGGYYDIKCGKLTVPKQMKGLLYLTYHKNANVLDMLHNNKYIRLYEWKAGDKIQIKELNEKWDDSALDNPDNLI